MSNSQALESKKTLYWVIGVLAAALIAAIVLASAFLYPRIAVLEDRMLGIVKHELYRPVFVVKDIPNLDLNRDQNIDATEWTAYQQSLFATGIGAMDRNNDQKVSIDELTKAMEGGSKLWISEKMDVNRDGQVSSEEFNQYNYERAKIFIATFTDDPLGQISEDDFIRVQRKTFDRIDQNKDHFISPNEWKQYRLRDPGSVQSRSSERDRLFFLPVPSATSKSMRVMDLPPVILPTECSAWLGCTEESRFVLIPGEGEGDCDAECLWNRTKDWYTEQREQELVD